MLSTEEEFFLVLVRLRGNYPVEDLDVRFNMSDSNISRILITWYDFLHTQLRALPVWASRKTVDSTMPKCFKETYPFFDIGVFQPCRFAFSSKQSHSILLQKFLHYLRS